MARTTKRGLNYFPLDVDFFEADSIELINAEFGIKGENIALRLLCLIYKNGYWYKLGEDESLLLAKRVGNGVTGALVSEIVKGLVKRSFFDERVFNSFQILTSRGIQERFFEAVERRKSVEIIPKIMLVHINDDINAINVDINSLNVDIGTQMRVKESKEKKSRGEESKGKSPPHPFSESEIFDKKIFEQKIIGTQYESANVDWYHEQIKNWAESKDEKKINWLSAAKNWMANDLKDGKFITKNFKPPQNGVKNHTGKQPTGAEVDTKSAFDAINRYTAKTGGT